MLRPLLASVYKRLTLLLAAAAFAGVIAPDAQAGQATPADIVERLHTALIGVMQQADALGFEGRYEVLAPTVSASYNLSLMARVTIGRHWNRLNEDEQARFIDAFTRMTMVNYASRFDDYSGERFEFVARDQTGRTVRIKTRLVKVDGEPIRLDYILRRYDGEWRIIDVLAKGSYSELATRRSEYTSIVKRQGFPALMSKLDKKITELAEKAKRK